MISVIDLNAKTINKQLSKAVEYFIQTGHIFDISADADGRILDKTVVSRNVTTHIISHGESSVNL